MKKLLAALLLSVACESAHAEIITLAGAYAPVNNPSFIGSVTIDGNAILSGPNAGQLQPGGPDAAAPVPQILSAQSVATGTSNTAGSIFSIYASRGTGTGSSGAIQFYNAPAGSSGSSQNTYTIAWQMTGGGSLEQGTGSGWLLRNTSVSGTTPSLDPLASDTSTGIGSSGAGKINLIAGGGNILDYNQTTASTLTSPVATTFSNATLKATALAQSTAADVLCYASSTGLITYETTGTTCTVSALKYKHLEGSITDANSFIEGLSVRTGHFKPEYQNQYGSDEHVWLIADEICKEDSRLCAKNSDGSVQGYDERGVLAYIVRDLQQQHAEILSLRRQLHKRH